MLGLTVSLSLLLEEIYHFAEIYIRMLHSLSVLSHATKRQSHLPSLCRQKEDLITDTCLRYCSNGWFLGGFLHILLLRSKEESKKETQCVKRPEWYSEAVSYMLAYS